MSDTIRIGLLGLVHDHVWGTIKDTLALEGAQLVAVSDPHEELLENVRRESGVENTYTDHEELLDREELDAVFVYDTNRRSAELAVEAAERGLHVMSEKPMAADLGAADRMMVAARQAGVLLMINWPTCWWPGLLHARELIQEGAIGRPWQLKWRQGHCGPDELGCSDQFCQWLFDAEENGGGAMFDFAGYGANIANWFLGAPSQVSAVSGRYVRDNIPVDDNALVALQYDHASAVIEATWTESVPGWPRHELVVYGTEGTLTADRDSVIVATPQNREGELHEPDELKPPGRNGAEYFLHCIRSDQEPRGMCSPQYSWQAQQVLEAARRSAVTGRRVSLPLNDHLYRG